MVWWALAILAVAALLRALFPLADPPWRNPIGITWHDEGVWAHNARNMALWGAWRVDEWNPMFVSPVFTGLEALAFAILGVGWWQARLVSIVAGTVSVGALAVGLRSIAARRTALAGSLLLAVNYTWVMYSRVALLEATMVALLVCAWSCRARSDSRAWGLAAAAFALAAFFTKASAAFFLVALGVDCLFVLLPAWRRGAWRPQSREETAALATLLALAAGMLLSIAVFVAPFWDEYRRYNLEIYGARRSLMTLDALIDRASWFPVIHGFFTRQYLLTAVALAGLFSVIVRLRTARTGGRLLALWLVLGALELVVHDLGNERRYVFLIPAMAGLAAIALMEVRSPLPPGAREWRRAHIALLVPGALAAAYVLAGSLTRLLFPDEISPAVRAAAIVSVAAVSIGLASWPWLLRISQRQLPVAAAWFLALLIAAGDLTLYARWASARTYHNYEASTALGQLLPSGTLVQGKLANGLALENRIRPLFIGPGFGNYEDRLARPDVGWILTYERPRLGYEGAVIGEVLEALPGWEVAARFPVSETPSGNDTAILIRKPAARPRVQ